MSKNRYSVLVKISYVRWGFRNLTKDALCFMEVLIRLFLILDSIRLAAVHSVGDLGAVISLGIDSGRSDV